MEEPSQVTSLPRKEAMKRLRESRRDIVESVARRVKDQKKTLDVIRECLKEGSRTVPEMAAQTGMDPAQVLWYIAALKKYGEVVEAEKEGSYFRYEAAKRPEEPPSEAPSPTGKG